MDDLKSWMEIVGEFGVLPAVMFISLRAIFTYITRTLIPAFVRERQEVIQSFLTQLSKEREFFEDQAKQERDYHRECIAQLRAAIDRTNR